MAKDPRKRQRKLERRNAKRKEKRHHLAVKQGAGLAERLTEAARYPVQDTWISEGLWDEGLGWVVLSRELPGGMVAFASFLVDRFCLGVKDAFANIMPRTDYETDFLREMKSKISLKPASAALARKVVEGAVAYAFDLGFPPHPDYHRSKLLFGTIDPNEWTEEIEFGDEGQPHFIAGPYDSQSRCRQIEDTLLRSCGPDRFQISLPREMFESGLPEDFRPGRFFPGDEEEDEEDSDDEP